MEPQAAVRNKEMTDVRGPHMAAPSSPVINWIRQGFYNGLQGAASATKSEVSVIEQYLKVKQEEKRTRPQRS
jgi:hypothetical protein